jgi:hypothetical protein
VLDVIVACLLIGMNNKSVNDDSEDDDDYDGLDLSLFPAVRDPSMAVNAPEENDIICGRGKSVTHPGNLKFRQMVLTRKEEYKQAKRREDKTRIATEIVEELRNGPKPSRYVFVSMTASTLDFTWRYLNRCISFSA